MLKSSVVSLCLLWCFKGPNIAPVSCDMFWQFGFFTFPIWFFLGLVFLVGLQFGLWCWLLWCYCCCSSKTFCCLFSCMNLILAIRVLNMSNLVCEVDCCDIIVVSLQNLQQTLQNRKTNRTKPFKFGWVAYVNQTDWTISIEIDWFSPIQIIFKFESNQIGPCEPLSKLGYKYRYNTRNF